MNYDTTIKQFTTQSLNLGDLTKIMETYAHNIYEQHSQSIP